MFAKQRLVLEHVVSPKKQYDHIQWLSEYAEKIAKILQIPYPDALYIVDDKAKKRVPMISLVARSKVIKALDIPPYPTLDLLGCLRMHTHRIEHRYWLLRDLGVEGITLKDIQRLPITLRLRGDSFKKHFSMHPDANIVENIFNNIGEYPTNMPSLDKYQNIMPVEDTYSHCLLCYKIWKTRLNWSRFACYYNRPKRSIDLLSFRLIKETALVLKTEFNVKEKIPKQMFPFFTTTPNSLRFLLSRLPEFNLENKNVKDILMRNPRLLFSCPENLYEVCKILQENGVPLGIALNRYRCAEIFILDSEIVKERLKCFSTDPFLQLWCRHNAVVYMLMHYQTVWRNLYILRATNLIWNANVMTICLSLSGLYRFIKGGYVAVNGKHVRCLLYGELGVNDKKLYEFLKRHPHWALLTPAHAAGMIQFMKEYFPEKAILDNIQLILHSRSNVIKALQQSDQICDTTNFTYSQRLALCLYVLEKQKCTVAFAESDFYKKKKRTQIKSKAQMAVEFENILNTVIPVADELR